MKYLILGSRGQLGSEFVKKLTLTGANFAAFDLPESDISNRDTVSKLFDAEKPEIVINCAAYNLVDNAETDFVTAYKANAIAPQNLAVACKLSGAKLVHYSTDYVFDGAKTDGLYMESDKPNPLNQYAKSKLAGEILAAEAFPDALILRVSWVFGSGNQNFIHKVKSWSEKAEFLKIAADEFSVPTYTADIVEVTLKALEADLKGTYHFSNGGYCSRFEWARLICELLNINKFIYPCLSSEFNLPAPRPKFSAMSATKICDTLGFDNRSWQDALSEFIRMK